MSSDAYKGKSHGLGGDFKPVNNTGPSNAIPVMHSKLKPGGIKSEETIKPLGFTEDMQPKKRKRRKKSKVYQLSGSAPVAPPPPEPFVRDTFTDAAGTVIPPHVGEIGATWATHPSFPTACVITNANRARLNVNAPGGASAGESFASAIPPTADYRIVARLRHLLGGVQGGIGILGRYSTTAPVSAWFLWYDTVAAQFQLISVVAGVTTTKGTFNDAWPVNTDRNVELSMNGNIISVTVGGVVVIGPITDSSVSQIGRVGHRTYVQAAQPNDDTEGFHFDKIEAFAL